MKKLKKLTKQEIRRKFVDIDGSTLINELDDDKYYVVEKVRAGETLHNNCDRSRAYYVADDINFFVLGYVYPKNNEKRNLKYLYLSKRGFANEYIILSVDLKNPHERALASHLNDLTIHNNGIIRFISRKEAYKLIAENKRVAARTCVVCNPVGATEIVSISEYIR